MLLKIVIKIKCYCLCGKERPLYCLGSFVCSTDISWGFLDKVCLYRN